MPIPVVCNGCGGRFSAPERGAGRKVPCPNCQAAILIPAAPPAAPPKPIPPPAARATWKPPTLLAASPAPTPAGQPPAWVPPTKSSTPAWLRHLHWCLALAMIPLAISIFGPDESPQELAERVLRSLAEANPQETAEPQTPPSQSPTASSSAPEEDADSLAMLEQMSLDDLMELLPRRKLQGALLARDSWFHWLFALLSVGAYMTFFVLLAWDRSARALHLLGLGAFTATFGVLLLVVVQVLAMIGPIGGRGIVGLILLLLSLIGLSYRAALDPDIGFVGSFLGFTLGVGLCEELIKALPIFVYYRIGNTQTWRGAFLWGLASGAGFGVSEGVMYSQDFYNGIAGPGIYVVRFVSCVALHAVWSGSVGIAIHQRQDLLRPEHEDWWVTGLLYVVNVLRLIAIPMILHGLYDTLLKKELELLALVVAAASFGYLAWLISRLRHSDDEDERAAYVASFIRSKAAETKRGSWGH
jgi:RsiW-degrading membrane proteinase PrsW (M82 family)